MSRVTLHMTTAVKGCKCDGCERKRARDREYAKRRKLGSDQVPHRVDQRILASRAKLDRAEDFLEDGASYAETAATLRMSEHTLRQKLPGYSENFAQFNSVMSTIKNNEPLLELHREIWQGGQYNKS